MVLYLIFFLVIIAGIIYLSLPFIRGDAFTRSLDPTLANDHELMKLKDQAETLKLALRDLDLENKIGKIDVNDFNLLKKELLAEWAAVEKKISEQSIVPAVKQDIPLSPTTAVEKFCPSCGREIARPGEDRFCRFCGAALKLSLLVATILLMLLPGFSVLDAYEIRVKLTNGTNPSTAVKAESISLISLENTMQEIARRDNPGSQAVFTNLPEPQTTPYMVQARYRGINYSTTVPPNRPSPAEVTLEVFEKTERTDKILFRMLSEARYIEGEKLHIFVLHYILNKGNSTFADAKGGLEVFIPQGASDISASVSVGSGASNIQWLRLQPVPSKNGWHSLPYPVKPGERMYQLEYKIDYQPQGTPIEFDSRYPLEVPLKLFLDPPDIKATLNGSELPAMYDDTLNRYLREIDLKKRTRLHLSGGTPQKATGPMEETTDHVSVASPLSFWEKILGPLIALTLILTAFNYLRRNPAWLRKVREREKIRLQAELRVILESSLSENEKRERSRELLERIKRLELYLSGRDEKLT